MSLKRHPSVVFVGIDRLDDLRNNSYNELFVSGGCIISDDLVLNPDFITQGTIRFCTHSYANVPQMSASPLAFVLDKSNVFVNFAVHF